MMGVRKTAVLLYVLLLTITTKAFLLKYHVGVQVVLVYSKIFIEFFIPRQFP